MNDLCIERVDNFRYLGTVLDPRLDFRLCADHIVSKVRKRLFIMKHLYAKNASDPIRIKCYETFIESVLRFHLPTIFGHLLAESKSKIDRCIKCAAKLSKVKLNSISDVYDTAFATRCLRLVAMPIF